MKIEIEGIEMKITRSDTWDEELEPGKMLYQQIIEFDLNNEHYYLARDLIDGDYSFSEDNRLPDQFNDKELFNAFQKLGIVKPL